EPQAREVDSCFHDVQIRKRFSKRARWNLPIIRRQSRRVLPSCPQNAWGNASRRVTTGTISVGNALVWHGGNAYNRLGSGRGAVWLARLNGVQEVAGSNPVAPT